LIARVNAFEARGVFLQDAHEPEGQEGGRIHDRARLEESPRSAMPLLAQVAVMGAIVASLLYFPLGVALALALRVAGFSFQAFVTFGGAFNVLPGLAIWWLLFFAGACIYAAFLMPWGEKVFKRR
jgi:hypothetical protein